MNRQLRRTSHIEGLAFHDGWLYAGFRGPLDRNNALVLRFRFEDPSGTGKLLAVDLGGLGIRDMTRVSEGFLILAGPMHDGAGPYHLHHWDGHNGPTAKVRQLGTIPSKADHKAEGLGVLREDPAGDEFLIFYDGPKGGEPKHFRLRK